MIKYPLLCTTHAAKMAFVERALRLLQKEHNTIGAWFREGIPLNRHEELRNKVQTEWPHTEKKLPEVEWKRYLKERFDIKTNRLLTERGILKEALYTSTRFSPNLDDDIINVS